MLISWPHINERRSYLFVYLVQRYGIGNVSVKYAIVPYRTFSNTYVLKLALREITETDLVLNEIKKYVYENVLRNNKKYCDATMTGNEAEAWLESKNFVHNFLGNLT